MLLPNNFGIQLFLKIFLILFKVFLLLLLCIVEFDYHVVHISDFFSLSSDDFLMILLNWIVIHFGITFIADSICFFILNGEFSFCFGTYFANWFTTTFTVTNRITSQYFSTSKFSFTKHAEFYIRSSLNSFCIKSLWKYICFINKFGLLVALKETSSST